MKKILAVLCVLIFAIELFAGCGQTAGPEISTSAGDAVVVPESETAGDAAAAATTAASSSSSAATTAPAATTAASDSSASEEKVAFPAGAWENSDVTYTFESDGSGSVIHKDNGTGVPFQYEVSDGKNELTVHMGGVENTEKVAYAYSDGTLTLTFEDGRKVALTAAAGKEDAEEETKSVVGTWVDSAITYTFNSDGSGSVINKDTGTGVPFDYEVSGSEITFHMGSVDNVDIASFELDGDTLALTFADGNSYTLERG